MINAKIIKVIAGCIASISIIGGIYFANNNREKADNAVVIESNQRSIVKESKDETSSNKDILKKEEKETKNNLNENNTINSNVDSNNEDKDNISNSKTEINQNNDESLDNKKDDEIQNNEGTQSIEGSQNSNMFLDIQDIRPETNHNNGQGVGSGSNINGDIPATEEQEVSSSNAYIAEIEQLIFQKVNEERVSAGLSPLNYNSTMEHYARLKSKDMGDRGYFDHADPEGKYITEQMKADGVSYRAWGENIAYISGASGNSALADRFMTNWMNSSGHRANILSTDFTSMGVGVYKIGNTYYATQEFYK